MQSQTSDFLSVVCKYFDYIDSTVFCLRWNDCTYDLLNINSEIVAAVPRRSFD